MRYIYLQPIARTLYTTDIGSDWVALVFVFVCFGSVVTLRTLRPGKRMATLWWVTRAHPDLRRRCQTDGRTASGPSECAAPSWPDSGIDQCHSGCPNRRQSRSHPRRTRRWAWIARVALQWRCSCSCLESGLCSYEKMLIVSISSSIVR